MDRFVQSIRMAVAHRNWYAALATALAMPDVCGWLEGRPQGRKRYIDWYEKYLLPVYMSFQRRLLEGADLYALRCAYLHQGADDITDQQAKVILNRFIFTSQTDMHRNWVGNIGGSTEKVLQLSAPRFCEDMCAAVERWSADTAGNPAVQARIRDLLTVHDELDSIP